jgi:hypothetical protein
MKDNSDFDVGISMLRARCQTADSLDDARIIRERRERREDLLLGVRGKKIGRLDRVFSGFRKKWLERDPGPETA